MDPATHFRYQGDAQPYTVISEHCLRLIVGGRLFSSAEGEAGIHIQLHSAQLWKRPATQSVDLLVRRLRRGLRDRGVQRFRTLPYTCTGAVVGFRGGDG